MNTETLSSLVTGLLMGAVGLAVALQERRRPPFRYLALFCSNLALFYALDFLGLYTEDRRAFLASYAVSALIPVTSIQFFREFLRPESTQKRSAGWLVPSISVGLVALAAYLFFVPNPEAESLLAKGVFFYVVAGLFGCIHIIHQRLGGVDSSVERTRLRYLMAGGAVAILAVVLGHVTGLGPEARSVGRLLGVLFIYFLSQMVYYERLMDLQEVLARLTILSILTFLITFLYVALTFWVPPDERGLTFFNTIMASVIVIILLDPIRSMVQERIHRYLFKERYELSRSLDNLRWRIGRAIDLPSLFEILMAGLNETRRVTHAAIYLSTQDETAFELKGHLGPQPPRLLETASYRVFLDRLRIDGVLLTETLQRARLAQRLGWEKPRQEDQALNDVLTAMNRLNAGICASIDAEGRVIGLLFVNDDRMREAFSPGEVDAFSRLADQVAIGVRNSILYERMKEKDRLAALGQMAAGLAHEIRNPLGAIRGAAQCLQDELGRCDSPADASTPPGGSFENRSTAGEFLDIVIEEVDRLNRVLAQFLNYARPAAAGTEPVDINKVLTRCAQLLVSDAGGHSIELCLGEDLPFVAGDPNQLQQVFLNLGLNALQAMEAPGLLTISSHMRKRSWREPDQIVITFADTGPGIPDDVQQRLFLPFFTTKPAGTGLGLALCQRIVETHEGRIEAANRPEGGARFRVFLPAQKPKDAADQGQDDAKPSDSTPTRDASPSAPRT